jgi:hypothetical protein
VTLRSCKLLITGGDGKRCDENPRLKVPPA